MAQRRNSPFREGKKAPFQCSPEVHRIIPCKQDYAYISDHNGKNHHLPRHSEQFIEIARETNEALNGKIARELEDLGWTDILESING